MEVTADRRDEPMPDLLQVLEGSVPANTEPMYIATPSGRHFRIKPQRDV